MEEKKFVIDNPKLMQEWDWEKNNELGLFPDKLTYGSNRSVWWKCEKKHSWKDSIYHRVSGRNCPYCANKRVLVGFNDLETTHPNIAKEWDYEKNEGLNPAQFVAGSQKKVWWKCAKCGHEWNVGIRYRTRRNSGCPICATEKSKELRLATILKKSGGIKDARLISEWNYDKNGDLKPSEVTEGSSKKVWWKCAKCGYEWQEKILNRKYSRNCPCCSNRVVVKGKNDLQTTNPKLVKEWNWERNNKLGIFPDTITHGVAEKVWWKCPNGHEYQATVLHRSSGTGCPTCNSGRQSSFAEQAIFFYVKKYFPDAKNKVKNIFGTRFEFDIFIPSINTAIEYDGGYWHEKQKAIENEEKKFNLCRKNGITLIRIREPEDNEFFNDVYTKITGNAVEYSKIKANYVLFSDKTGNNKNLNKVIENLFSALNNISMFYKPFGGNNIVEIDVDSDREEILKLLQVEYPESLAIKRPDLAKEWHCEKNGTLTPSQVSYNTRVKVWWKCSKCGHEWKTAINLRNKGSGCPECAISKNKGGTHAEAKVIYQYSIDGQFIKKWECISTAGRELKINSPNITRCAKHKCPHAGGFRWEYVYNEKLEPIETK